MNVPKPTDSNEFNTLKKKFKSNNSVNQTKFFLEDWKNKLFHKLASTNLLRPLTGLGALFGVTGLSGQSFDAPVGASIFNLPENPAQAITTSADLDNDGDLDLIICSLDYDYAYYDYTLVQYFENVGTPESPVFSTPNSNLIPLPPVTEYTYIYLRGAVLADLDNDGDFDLLMSEYKYEDGVYYDYHQWLYFENVGTPEVPNFANPISNPFGLQTEQYFSFFDLADIDNDGDLDLFSQGQSYYNTISFQENIGNASTPNFGPQTLNPFGLTPSDQYNFPELGDLDNDGDLDLLSSGYDGDFNFFENTGNASNPLFSSGVQNPFGLVPIEGITLHHLLDIDTDGDLDILSGTYGYDYTATLNFYKNTLITGLEDISNQIKVDLFPNPSSNWIQVRLPDLHNFQKMEVLNAEGRLIMERNVNNNYLELDISSLAKGNYQLLLRSADEYYTAKFIKN